MPSDKHLSDATENEHVWIEHIQEAILDGDAENTMSLVKGALNSGIAANFILKEAVVASMSAVGRDFKNGEFYIPDVLMCSRASHAALFAMQNDLNMDEFNQPRGKAVVGTVAGDLHDIGKNIAALMLRCEGFEVIDLGIDVVPERFVEAVKTHDPDIVGLSALLTTTIREMGNVIEALDRAGLRKKARIYVSGLPVTQEFADSIGADHYCEDARDTVEYAKSTLAEKQRNKDVADE